MAEQQVLGWGTQSAPASRTTKDSEVFEILALDATFDGTATTGRWVPTLQIVSDAGSEVGSFPLSISLAAGDSATVTFAPFSGSGQGGSPASVPEPQQVVLLDTPDGTNGFPALSTLNGFSNVHRVVNGYPDAVDAYWEGAIRVPGNYVASPLVILTGAANATTGAVRMRVGSSAVSAGTSMNAAYTFESYQNVTVPGSALFAFDITFNLSTTPAVGDTLNVRVERDGGNAADTLAATFLLWQCVFAFTSA